MATNSYGFTYPLADDQVDGSGAIKALADSVGPYSIMRFASAAARDAFILSPAEGMHCWLQDVNGRCFYDGAAWQLEGAWTAYTPSWTGATNPVIGNGSIVGRYCQLGVKTVAFKVKIAAGTTTTQGTGNQNITLPFTAVSTDQVFSTVLHTGAVYYSGATAYIVSAVTAGAFYVMCPAVGGFMGAGTGVHVGTAGYLIVSGVYEAL